MPIAALAFTPSSYISLQAITSTHIYTMEVSSSFGRIEKFNERPSTISLRESRQLSQLWFVNWSSSMVLITSRHSHSNNWPIMCIMRHWMFMSNIFQRCWLHSDPQSSLCCNHHHCLSSCTTSSHCTSWDCA